MPHRRNFKGQFEDELVLCFFRKHWIAILPRLLALVLLMCLLVLGVRYFLLLTRQTLFVDVLVVTSHIVITYLIHRQFLAIFHYFLYTVLITNYRVVGVDKSVFFRDSKNSVDLSKIQDIRKVQNGIFENILNFGTLTIILSGTHDITLVPRPDYQFKKINKVKQTYWPQAEQREGGFVQAPVPSPVEPRVMEEETGEEDYVTLLEKAMM